MSFQFRILEDEIAYTGAELRSGWVAAQTGLAGDAAAGFVGPCHVPTENLVDLDDARAGTFIQAASMAHVIAEHPCELSVAVLRQRILVALLGELLRARENGCAGTATTYIMMTASSPYRSRPRPRPRA